MGVKGMRISSLLGMVLTMTILAADAPPEHSEVPVASEEITDGPQVFDPELNKAACAFKEKKYAEALSIFETAQQRGSTHPGLPLFIARSTIYQYKKNDRTPANIAIARRAIAAYEKLLGKREYNSEAISSIADLYFDFDRNRVGKIASSEETPASVRSALFLKLASESNSCASDLVETSANRTEIRVKGETTYRYKMPAKRADYVRAKQCADDGLVNVDRALKLDPKTSYSWSLKASLLKLLSNLAEMEGNAERKEALAEQVEPVLAEYKRLSKEERDAQDRADEEELEKIKTAPKPEVEDAMLFVESGKYRREPENFVENLVQSPLHLLVPPPDIGMRSDEARERRRQAVADAATPWRRFAPVGEGFSVTMPPKVKKEEAGTGPTLFTARSEDIEYLIMTMGIPSDTPMVHPRTILATAAWGNISSVCNFSVRANSVCEVDLVRDLKLAGKPGLQYAIKQTQCASVVPGVLRVYMTGARLFLIQTLGADERDARVKRFLDSFAFAT
jgi:tetratricopeptide (TPR) repeat protein